MNGNNILADHYETSEEILGPAKIDLVGIALMAMVSVIIGGLISVAILVASFFSIGQFSIESGVSPMILSMVTFFALTFGGMLYLTIARLIFPAIYTRTEHSFKHLMMFMMVLYICMVPVYLAMPTGINQFGVIIAYLVHILLAVFGIELIISVIAQYRYVLLSFYANLTALIFSAGIVYMLMEKFTQSNAKLFVMIGLSILAFFLSTTLIFIIKFLYYKFYTLTGNDPLGSLFYQIEAEERQKVINAQNNLLK